MGSIGVHGAKFWHGKMTAGLIFPMSNPFFQGNAAGICTAASLAWCKACLKKNRHVNSFQEVGSPHVLNVQMAVLRRFDANPTEQTDRAGLALVGEWKVGSVDEMLAKIGENKPYTGIFWTRTHTMGYRYSHHEKEFFDVENGLFRAKYTAAIKAAIEHFGYGTADPVEGCRVVRLKD